MKKLGIVVLGGLLSLQTLAQANKMDSISYTMGYQLGTSFKHANLDLDQNSFLLGLQSGYSGMKSALDQSVMKAAVDQFKQHMVEANKAKLKKVGEANMVLGKDFLEKNKNAKGVVTLENGLQYKILEEGSGKKPLVDSTIIVDYEGSLIDGTVFDSSYKRGTPAEFRVNQVISGWTQALQMMKEGATWMIYIPSDLAYGERGAGPIAPNSVLIFKVHLREIK